jgi:hypothetical protein
MFIEVNFFKKTIFNINLMRKTRLLVPLILMVTSIIYIEGCKKKDFCTDKDASNYKWVPFSETNEGCIYKGDVVFWYDQNTANLLGKEGVIFLNYYLDGQLKGSSAITACLTTAPECGQDCSLTVSIDLDNEKNKVVMFLIKDQDGALWFEQFVKVYANSCTKQQLIWW